MTTTRTTGAAGTRSSLWTVVVRSRDALVLAWGVPPVRQGFLAMVLVALGAFSPAFVNADAPLYTSPFFALFLTQPFRLACTAIVLVGLLQLFDAWLRLRPAPGGPAVPVAGWVWWSLPVVAVPPLFSRDAYSYAAQGLVVSRGMDPYGAGPIAVPGPFADQVDGLWLFTAAPYGPTALQVQRMVVEATGGHALLAAIAMRIPALLAVAAIAWALPRLARRMGVSADQAVWFGVLNPLVLMHFVGGSHNDAMMMAFVVLGLLVACDGRLLAASALVAAGASFKQTAVLALVGVAGLVYRHRRGLDGEAPLRSPVDRAAYLRVAVVTGTLSFLAFAAITLVTGLGWGWVHNLGVPGQVVSVLSPVTMAGSGVAIALTTLGVPQAWVAGVVPGFQAAGLIGIVVACAWIALRVAPRRPVAAAAWALCAFTLGSATVYPWYVLWGVLLFGATATDRRVVRVVVVLFGWLLGYSMLEVAVSNGATMIGVAAVAWGTWSLWRRRAELDRPLPPVRPGDAISGAASPTS